jgi:hypothetical protein
MHNGRPDQAREIKCGPEIAAHSPQLRAINEKIETIYNGCPKADTEHALIQSVTPCNYFAGVVMRDVYGVRDFISDKGGFLSASQIADYLKESFLTNGPWQNVGGGDAIVQANAGRPVMAVSGTQGHVAVVLPGGYDYSYKWHDYTPVSASMFMNDPQSMYNDDESKRRFIFRCMPCFSNNAFAPNPPDYYFRTK